MVDIETAPNLGWTWEKYETNVIEFVEERYILCFTVKWLDGKSFTYGLPDFTTYSKDPKSDKELVIKLKEYLDEADIIVGHNSDNFDLKIINARCIVNGLTPPSPYRTVDTKKEAKKRFGFNSNSLNDLCKILGIGGKYDTGGFKLWKDCMSGKAEAWKKMRKYNKIDVMLLEQLYLRMRPWMKTHPNVAIHADRLSCQACGSSNTQKRGLSYSKYTKYQRIQCLDCASWSQGPIEK